MKINKNVDKDGNEIKITDGYVDCDPDCIAKLCSTCDHWVDNKCKFFTISNGGPYGKECIGYIEYYEEK